MESYNLFKKLIFQTALNFLSLLKFLFFILNATIKINKASERSNFPYK